ncbi:hypothetical protein [Nitrospira sp. Nam74]
MSRDQIGEFKFRLAAYAGNRTTVIALQILLYNFVRTVELRLAEWAEFNDKARI